MVAWAAGSALPLIVLSAFLHAGWNLLARAQRAPDTFLRITVLISLAGLPFVFGGSAPLGSTALPGGQALARLFPPAVWGLLAVAGVSQAVYFLGLSRAYQSGDFTVVYPLARSLPILVLALIDATRGRLPSLLGWLGLFLVSLGCVVIPLRSPADFRLARYWNGTTGWVAVAALGTVGYSTVDKIAAELIPSGLLSAGRYQVLEYVACLAPLALLLWRLGGRSPAANFTPVPARLLGWSGGGMRPWLAAALAALGMFAAYWLVLYAYQLSRYASYVLALRQLSIVIGAAAGAVLFHEPAGRLRIGAALIILAGAACIAFAG